jgi:hypothetical protein
MISSTAKKLIAVSALTLGVSALTLGVSTIAFFAGNIPSASAQENVAVPCNNPLLCNTEEVSQFKKVDACFLLLKKDDDGYEYPTATEMEARKDCKTISTQIREKWATFERKKQPSGDIFFTALTGDVSFCQTSTGLWKSTGTETECDKYGLPLKK